MIDDDVKFMRRNTYNTKTTDIKTIWKRSRLMTESDWDDMYYLMNQWMDEGLFIVDIVGSLTNDKVLF